MTLIGLFSGAKTAATPVGSATAAEGGADFAALLGAVATPTLFTATPGAVSPASAPAAASPSAPALALAPSEIQENGASAGAPTPAIPGIPVRAADQTPEFSKGEQGAVIAGGVSGSPKPEGSAASGAPRARKTADAVADVSAPVAPAPAADSARSVASVPSVTPLSTPAPTPAAASAAAPASDAVPSAAAIVAAVPVGATASSAPAAALASAAPVATITVSGVEVELVVASVADKPAAVKQTTPDASGSAIAGVVAPGGTGGAASAAPAAAAPVNAPANAPTFSAQVAKPLFTLAAGPAGEHVVTVNVTPDNLGPVTVRAHVGTDGMRVELFAPNDAGREAIRSILPDLRRDLAGQGVAANLDLSSQSQPFDRGGDTAARDRTAGQNLQARQDSAPRDGEQPSRRPHTSTSLLDVLA